MSGLLSSPGKQAQQGASGLQGIDQSTINQLEQYVGQQQQNERGAIAGVGANPYFTAAQAMNPSAYAVNPAQQQVFGSTGGPGTHMAAPTSVSLGPAAPPWKPPEPRGGGGGAGSGGGPGNRAPYVPPPGMGGPNGGWPGQRVGHEPL